MVCWMSDEPLRPGGRYALKHTTRTVRAIVRRAPLPHRRQHPAPRRGRRRSSALNDIGRVRAAHQRAAVRSTSTAATATTGSFILVDEATNDTVGAGMIDRRPTAPSEAPDAPRSAERHLARRRRSTARSAGRRSATRGATVWLTGLPASGKSTIAGGARAAPRRAPASPPTCSTATTCATASTATSASAPRTAPRTCAAPPRSRACSPTPGVVAIVSLVSPYAADREPRARAPRRGRARRSSRCSSTRRSRSASAATRRASTRRRARGEITDLTGVDDPYERPESPDIVLLPDDPDPVGALLVALEDLGVQTAKADPEG